MEKDFIKMILTKNQSKSKKYNKRVRIRKSRYIESDRTHGYTEKFKVAFSLYEVLRIALYLSKDFSGIAIGRSVAAETL